MKNATFLKLLVLLIILGHSVVGTGQLLSPEELKAGNYKEIDRLLTLSDSSEMGLFEEPDVFPMYPGGIEGVLRDFTANIVYPMKARRKGYQGQFAIQYVIEPDGTISSLVPIETHGPVHDLLIESAIRAISGMKKWYPCFHDNEPVRFLFTQPVIFKLTK